jgi:ProP effector
MSWQLAQTGRHASPSSPCLEEIGLIEERSSRLLEALEGRTTTLLDLLQQEREAHRRLAGHLAELEARLAEAEAGRLDLLEERRKLVEEHRELVEENRELDEQNRELEEHNRHLHERLASGQGERTFPRPARRSQGLSALIGRQAPPGPVGARFIGRKAEPESPDTSATPPAGARGIEQKAEPESLESSPSPDSPATPPATSRFIERSDETPSPQALLAEWYQRYPGAFFKGHTRPLMVGIHEALAEREPWPEKLVRRALACYVNLPRYLKAVREGAERIDLAGNPVGGVDAQAAEHARKKLDRLQAERRGKTSQAAGKPRRQATPAGKGGERRAETGSAKASPAATPAHNPPHGQAPHPARDQAPTPAAGQARGERHPAGPSSSPASLEEKLSALVAKHNRR